VIIFAVRGSKRFSNDFKKVAKKVHDAVARRGWLPGFAFYDFDGDHELSKEEIRLMYKEAYPKRPDNEIEILTNQMFGIMDTNNDGKVTEKEFRKACKKNPDAHELASILAVRLKGRKHRKVKRKWKKEHSKPTLKADKYDSQWDKDRDLPHSPRQTIRSHGKSKQLERAKSSRRYKKKHPEAKPGEDVPLAMMSSRAEESLSRRGSPRGSPRGK